MREGLTEEDNKRLSDDDVDAIATYKGVKAREINGDLMFGFDGKNGETIKNLDAAILKAAPLEKQTVWRGLSSFPQKNAGDEFVHFGYASTSPSMEKVKHWTNGSGSSPTILKIKVPDKHPGIDLRGHLESEVLLPREMKFKVDSVSEIDGISVYELSVLSPASEKSLALKFNPHHDARGRFASGSSSKIKPSVGSATSTAPPAAFIAAVAQSKIDNEGWEERLVAHQAVQERLLKKIDAALEKDDNGTPLTPEQKAAYRSAFVNVTDNMNNHAIEALEQHLDDVKFYASAQSLTDKLVGLDRMEPGKVILGAWSGTSDGANGSLHLDGGPGGKHDKFAAQQVYAHEVAHAIDWVPGSVTKIPVHKLKVSADEAEKTILARIDKLPISAQQKEAERANVLWNLGEPDSFAAIGVKTDDLYQLTGHRELHRPGREISRSAKWISAHNQEIDALDARGVQTFPLSKYATTSASEGFAEFGRLVFTAPREAKRQYPKCWAVWLEHGLVGNPAQQKKASAE